MSVRFKCRKCSAMILETTVRANVGFCGQCVKTRGMRYRLGQIRSVSEGLVLLIVLPFGAAWWGARAAWRRWRFPFDLKAMRAAIQAAMADGGTAQSYGAGVVEGYWDSAPANRAVFTAGRARLYGEADGGRLRRGEITFSEIPTHRPPWLNDATMRRRLKGMGED